MFVDNMSRGLWWIITAIMLVVFMPIGILLLGIVILREIFFMLNGDVEEEVEEKQVKEKKFKYSDSRLIVRQVNGTYRVTTDNLKALHRKTIQKMLRCCGVQIRWIRRDKNKAGRHLEKIKHSLK